jgi:hypothetical protein
MKKYGICTIVKDEEHILNEWIIHNFLLGFQHIYIYDDLSIIPVEETIKDLDKSIKDIITIFRIDINFHNSKDFPLSLYYDKEIHTNSPLRKQMYYINYFVKYYRNSLEWCLFIDCDEFFYLKDEYTFENILNTYKDYDLIYFPWLIYGSSYHIENPKNRLVIDSFRYHSDKYLFLGKSIAKMEYITNIICIHDLHCPKNQYRFNHNNKIFDIPIHLNHYQINSIKTYIKRKLRPEIGWDNERMRTAKDIYSFMLSYNDLYDNTMSKYADNIINLLPNNYIKCLDKDNLKLFFWKNTNYTIPYQLYLDNKPINIIDINNYEDIMRINESNNIEFKINDSIIPEDFYPDIYKKINIDLQNMSNQEALNHYVIFGYYENRKYKLYDDFKPSVYKNLYEDLMNFTDEEAICHYINHGEKEGRKYL